MDFELEDKIKLFLPYIGVAIALTILVILIVKYVPLDPTKQEVKQQVW